MAAVGNIGPEVRRVVPLHGGHAPAADHLDPHVVSGARFAEFLQQEGAGGNMTLDLFLAMAQKHLGAKGAVAFLKHQRQPQVLYGPVNKRRKIAALKISFGCHHGLRLRHGAQQCLVGQRLVVAQGNGLGAVKHRQPLLFQGVGQRHILVPKQHKIRLWYF